jgi:cytochrome c oxidase subunit 2
MVYSKLWKWLGMMQLSLFASTAWSDWAVNMPKGVTDISRDIYDLHMLIFWICVVIGVAVFGVMIVSMLMHRKSLGVTAADFHESTKVEIAWTVIPFLILIGMAVPATNTLRAIYDASDAEIDIEVRGYQWKWQYTYMDDNPEQQVSFFSNMSTSQDEIQNLAKKGEHYLLEVDEPMVIPVNTRVRFLITSNDVIHSWWVPQFGVKKDAIPGFLQEAWTKVNETGIFRGQCTELCGKDHGFMPIVVRVVERNEYDEWLAAKQSDAIKAMELTGKEWTMDELMVRGEASYLKNCASCHQANGEGIPPAFPALKGSPMAIGDMQTHVAMVLDGKAGTAMQAFGSQLDAADIAAIVTYERNAWGNNMGDMIQPKEILAIQAAQ